MKHLIFLVWLLFLLPPAFGKDIIIEDTIRLIVNDSSEYSKHNHVLTIFLSQKYNPEKKKEWKKVKKQLEMMVVEVDLERTTLRYTYQTIVRDEKGISVKISLANLLAQYYAKSLSWKKITKERIMMIKNKGENWRLIKIY